MTSLDDLKQKAAYEEHTDPYCTLDRRTAREVVDPTPYLVYPRLQLLVSVAYNDFIERMCTYGQVKAAQTAARRSGSGWHYVYICWCDGYRYELTEEEARQLLETRELPVPVYRVVEPDEDPEDLFESLNPIPGSASMARVGS